MTIKELSAAQREFLHECSVVVSGTEFENVEKAARKGVQAASQRSRLYSKNTDKREIGDYWVERLRSISEDYKKPQTFCKFLEDVLKLKEDMNNKFPDSFDCGVDGYAPRFRLAHAQKSLSVCLKHLWCMDIIPEPPMCPIDRGILWKVGIHDCWTKLDEECLYESWKNAVWQAAEVKHLSITQWELLCWNGDKLSR